MSGLSQPLIGEMTGGQALGFGMHAMGGMFKGQAYAAGASAYRYQSRIFEKEAEVAEQQGLFEAERIRTQGDKLIGAQKATYAKAGVFLEGSPLLVMQEQARTAELDALMLRYSAQLEKQRLLEQAEVAKRSASDMERAEDASVFGSLFGAGVGSVLAMSDVRCKENLEPVTSALEKIRQLRAFTYNFVGDDDRRMGLIAQDLEKVAPECVREIQGVKFVDQYALQSLIVAALAELAGSD